MSSTEAKELLRSNPFLHLVDELVRLQGRVQTLFSHIHEETGLNRFEQLVLTSVLDARAPPTVSQIGRSLGYPRQGIQRAANSLEAAGLLEKLPNPDHKRAPLLSATPAGVALKEKSDRLALAMAEAFLGRANGSKCLQLAEDLQDLRREIQIYLRDSGRAGGEKP